jgi:hypothetical protein
MNGISFSLSWTDEDGNHSLNDQPEVEFGLFAERIHVVAISPTIGVVSVIAWFRQLRLLPVRFCAIISK